MTMNPPKKLTAVVVGSSEPFGREIVDALKQSGFTIIAVEGRAGELAAAISGAGAFDALVINRPFHAGTTRFLEIGDAQFDAAVERALVEPLLAIQAAVPQMKEGGAIVEVTSRAHLGAWLSADVAAACGAAATMGRCLAIELAKQGIRVNVVAPPFVEEVEKSAAGAQHIGTTVAYFASPASRPASGLTYMLDGVASMQLGEMARR
jgi:NAD(P)-dependent dehydrogenase (short-subunit alcohol dehydrogenase family)